MSAGPDQKLVPTETIAALKDHTRRPSLASLVADIKTELGGEWLPEIYRQRVLTLRTRSHALGPVAKNSPVEIQHTLLGVELKIGRRRWQCPDLTTARYLAVFARLRCAEVAIPYDITKVSRLADELESSWHRMLLLADRGADHHPPSFRARLLKAAIAQAGAEVNEAGPGERIPRFNQNTKQRHVA